MIWGQGITTGQSPGIIFVKDHQNMSILSLLHTGFWNPGGPWNQLFSSSEQNSFKRSKSFKRLGIHFQPLTSSRRIFIIVYGLKQSGVVNIYHLYEFQLSFNLRRLLLPCFLFLNHSISTSLFSFAEPIKIWSFIVNKLLINTVVWVWKYLKARIPKYTVIVISLSW